MTQTDLDQLSGLLVSAGIGDHAQIEKATELSSGLGRFIRSLVGMERAAVAAAFSAFVSDSHASADQIEFVDLVIEHLTAKGMMDPKALYTSPFTDVAPSGPEQVFDLKRTDRLIEVIESFNASAVG